MTTSTTNSFDLETLLNAAGIGFDVVSDGDESTCAVCTEPVRVAA
jgi:hypothetical protein